MNFCGKMWSTRGKMWSKMRQHARTQSKLWQNEGKLWPFCENPAIASEIVVKSLCRAWLLQLPIIIIIIIISSICLLLLLSLV